jgi:cobaltochelatase CobN
VQDLPETDLLLARDYAAHEGGFAAAMKALGRPAPALYHLDATRPETPRAHFGRGNRPRGARARRNPRWAQGMMRHGFRGAAEITATLDNLAAFAQLTGQVPAISSTCVSRPRWVRATSWPLWMRPTRRTGTVEARFAALAEAGLWATRRNSIAAQLADRP